MCNCGNKRKEFSQAPHANSVHTQAKPSVQPPGANSSFEYVGKTALTVTGNVTGTQYRFNYPGSRQNIDYRDIAGIRTVPVLKAVT